MVNLLVVDCSGCAHDANIVRKPDTQMMVMHFAREC